LISIILSQRRLRTLAAN